MVTPGSKLGWKQRHLSGNFADLIKSRIPFTGKTGGMGSGKAMTSVFCRSLDYWIAAGSSKENKNHSRYVKQREFNAGIWLLDKKCQTGQRKKRGKWGYPGIRNCKKSLPRLDFSCRKDMVSPQNLGLLDSWTTTGIPPAAAAAAATTLQETRSLCFHCHCRSLETWVPPPWQCGCRTRAHEHWAAKVAVTAAQAPRHECSLAHYCYCTDGTRSRRTNEYLLLLPSFQSPAEADHG